MPKELTPADRQTLRGRAHRLDPVVWIGADGLTAAVLAELERTLKAHALIKIRVMAGDGDTRERLLGEICAATGSLPVQHIGKVLVVYRERPPAEQPAANPQAGPARGAIRSRRRARPSCIPLACVRDRGRRLIRSARP
jgi:putative YhbY family RNA-binding protein